MPRLYTELIMHHLSIALDVKTVKQKLRKMHCHVALLVKAELKKLLKANFIRAIDYAKWFQTLFLFLSMTNPFEYALTLEP